MKQIHHAILIALISMILNQASGQGYNHNWLIGYASGIGLDTNVTSTKARLLYNSNSLNIVPETRKMAFRASQGNISDQNGNLLAVSNGCWIANALGDTMLNGSGLNTGGFTANGWCDQISGMPVPHGNMILPFPGDSTKFILFHQIETQVFYSLIDMTLDGGLGGVTLKNIPVLTDSISWGISACRHANGRDWWVVGLRDNSNLIYKILLTPDTIASITAQNLNMPPTYIINGGQPAFSPDGTKFAYTFGYGGVNGFHDVRVFNFDRCSGYLDSLTYVYSGLYVGLGLSFSPNSNVLYHSSPYKIYQIDLTTFQNDSVAVNDGYYSPYPPFQTDFFLMYLAANGKIYISSGNGVIDLHVINYPDNIGLACDVQQHSLHLPCYSGRGNVNHPNYYLGAADGTVCDSLGLNPVNEPQVLENTFKIKPNPSNGQFSVLYILPQGESGMLEVFNLEGKRVYYQMLPPWSTLQTPDLSFLEQGVYHAVISSGSKRASKRMVIIK
jgi:hypothetical protein